MSLRLPRFVCVEKGHDKDLVFEADEEDYSYERLKIAVQYRKNRKGFNIDAIEFTDDGRLAFTRLRQERDWYRQAKVHRDTL